METMYYLTHSWRDKRVHTFSKSIYLKVNAIGWTHYDIAVQYISHYVIETPLPLL